MSGARPAPSAARTAISRARPVARASSRLATLAQAISSTKPTAPLRISTSRTDIADERLVQRRERECVRGSASGFPRCSRRYCWSSGDISARACARERRVSSARSPSDSRSRCESARRAVRYSRSRSVAQISVRGKGKGNGRHHADDGIDGLAQRDRFAEDGADRRKSAAARERD